MFNLLVFYAYYNSSWLSFIPFIASWRMLVIAPLFLIGKLPIVTIESQK